MRATPAYLGEYFMRRSPLIVVGVCAVGLVVAASTADAEPAITEVDALPAIGLADFQPTIADDHGIDLGSIGSDLYRDARDGDGEYWAVTDRGPNDKDGDKRTFLVPDFDPTIVHLRASGGTITVLDAIALRTKGGAPVTGMPNVPGYDETPYDESGDTVLDDNPNGLDTEGLVRVADGTFWLADEYAPSLVHVSAGGTVLDRFVPRGWTGSGADYPVHATLPSILLKRHANHGFESLALSGNTLYAAVQGPLDNPDSDESRNARIFAFDLGAQRVTAEYVHRFEKVCDVDPDADCKGDKTDQGDLTNSAMAALGNDRLLVEQHTDNAARLYTADLSNATNILGTKWDSASTSPSLEDLDGSDLDDADLDTADTSTTLNLGKLGLPGKIEGIAVLDPYTVAVANDNDFGVADQGDKSRIWTITVPDPRFS